ncbi:hypothetical protein JW911_01230 [Candidatus Peregrinibacteria bacterium]|nr:hypothetical protein [Candidatus Peregrinibacteria bacterium]
MDKGPGFIKRTLSTATGVAIAHGAIRGAERAGKYIYKKIKRSPKKSAEKTEPKQGAAPRGFFETRLEKEAVTKYKGPERQFEQELYYQAYRVDNILANMDAKTKQDLLTKAPALSKDPMILRFLTAHSTRTMNVFVGEAIQKTQEEREKLLNGIRLVLHEAKTEHAKKEAQKAAKKELTNEEKEQKAEQEKEAKEFERIMKKELNESELMHIEDAVSKPLDIRKGQLDMNKIQHHYKSIMMAQKALGQHATAMQKKFNEAETLRKSLYKNKSWIRKRFQNNFGVVDWLGRKAAWLGRKVSIVKNRSDEDIINDKIKPIKKAFAANLDRIKKLQVNIDARAKEIKDGLGVFKGDIREKLKELIAREDWTKAEETAREAAKKQLENKKKELGASLDKAKQEGVKINSAKNATVIAEHTLKDRIARAQGGETALNERIELVQKRILELEKVFGPNDPRVIAMKKDVLNPLIDGQDTMIRVRQGTMEKLTEVQERNQKLDIIKSDLYLNQTKGVSEIEKLELVIKNEDKRIEVIKSKRRDLHKLIENVETANIVVEQFKTNVSTNIDKMTKGNAKFTDALYKQNKYLQAMRAKEPGFGTSVLKKTFMIAWPLAFADYTINRIPGYVWAGIQYLRKGKASWQDTKDGSFTGITAGFWGFLNEKYDKHWLKKDGFHGAVKPENWFTKALCSVGNAASGAVGTVLGLLNGAAFLIHQPALTIDSMGEIMTSWTKLKQAGAEMIHYNDFKEGRISIGAGKLIGDMIILYFTAGTSAGASAASKGASTAGKAALYAYGFSKEILRKAVYLPINLGKGLVNMGKWVLDWTIGLMKAGKGSRSFLIYKHLVLTGKRLTSATDDLAAKISERGPKLVSELPGQSNLSKALKYIDKKGGFKKMAENVGKEGGMTAEQFEKFLKRFGRELKNEMYHPTSGWLRKRRIELIGREYQKYMRAKTACEYGQKYLVARGLIRNPKIGIPKVNEIKNKIVTKNTELESLQKEFGTKQKELSDKRSRCKELEKQQSDKLNEAAKSELEVLSGQGNGSIKALQTEFNGLRDSIKNATKELNQLKNKLALEIEKGAPLETARDLIEAIKDPTTYSISEKLRIKRRLKSSIEDLSRMKVPEAKTLLTELNDKLSGFGKAASTKARLQGLKETVSTRAQRLKAVTASKTEFAQAIKEIPGNVKVLWHNYRYGPEGSKVMDLINAGKVRQALNLYNKNMLSSMGPLAKQTETTLYGYIVRLYPGIVNYITRAGMLESKRAIDSLPEQLPPKSKAEVAKVEAEYLKELEKISKQKNIHNN